MERDDGRATVSPIKEGKLLRESENEQEETVRGKEEETVRGREVQVLLSDRADLFLEKGIVLEGELLIANEVKEHSSEEKERSSQDSSGVPGREESREEQIKGGIEQQEEVATEHRDEYEEEMDEKEINEIEGKEGKETKEGTDQCPSSDSADSEYLFNFSTDGEDTDQPSGDSSVGKNIPDDQIVGKNIPDDQSVGKNIPDDQIVGKNIPDDQSAGKNIAVVPIDLHPTSISISSLGSELQN